jgi:hypothetical protein
MTQSDFNANFRNLLNEPLPPAPDPRHIAFELFQADQRRTRVLAALSLIFWVMGTAGIFLLVFNLNRIVMEAEVHPYRGPNPSVFQTAPDDPAENSMDSDIHRRLPPIAFTKMCAVVEVSVVALLIAALLTVALIFSSRQATLNRINISLMQIAEQLSQASQGAPSGGSSPAGHAGFVYSLPPSGGRSGASLLVKILIILALLLLLGFPALWLAARSAASRAQAENAMRQMELARADLGQGYPRLSPFEAMQWRGDRPLVQVGGKWYELLAMNGLPTEQIVSLCQTLDPSHWQKRFEEDLVEVLVRSGKPYTSTTAGLPASGPQATLEVKDLESGKVELLRDIPMTEANRQALWRAAATRPAP